MEKITRPRKLRPPFRLECAARVESALKTRKEISDDLLQRSLSTFSTPDSRCRVTLLTSRNHRLDGARGFFCGLHSYHKEFLDACESGWLAVGGDSSGAGTVFLIPWGDFSTLLPKLRSSKKSPGLSYLEIWEENPGELMLSGRPGFSSVDLSPYILRTGNEA